MTYSFGSEFGICICYNLKCTMYQRKVDVDMLRAVKSVLADVSSVREVFALTKG